MSVINILYVSHSANLYGAEQSLLELLRGLERRQFNPIVVLPKNGPLKHSLSDLNITTEVVPTLTAWLTDRPKWQRPLHHLAVLPFVLITLYKLLKFVRRYSVHMIHSNSLVVIDGALAAKLAGIPHIWHAREMLNGHSPYNFLAQPCIPLTVVSRLSTKVICTSQAVARCFDRCSSATTVNHEIVYNATEPSNEKTVLSRKIRTKYSINSNSPLILQLSYVKPIKGCIDLIKAAAIVCQTRPDAVFLLVGSEPDPKYRQHLLNLRADFRLEKNFYLTGFQKDAQAVITEADIVVSASHYESFGRTLIEAMHLQKPVIGTAVGGIPEIIDHGVTGFLVPPQCPDALAEAILNLLQNPQLQKKLGQAGQEKAKTVFSLNNHLQSIQSIYTQVVEQNGYR